MARLALEDWLEDGDAFELVGVGLVGRRCRDIERDRIGDLRLVVVRIARGHRLLRLEIGLDAGGLRDLVVVHVHQGERIHIIALALGLGADLLRFLNRCQARLKFGAGIALCGLLR